MIMKQKNTIMAIIGTPGYYLAEYQTQLNQHGKEYIEIPHSNQFSMIYMKKILAK